MEIMCGGCAHDSDKKKLRELFVTFDFCVCHCCKCLWHLLCRRVYCEYMAYSKCEDTSGRTICLLSAIAAFISEMITLEID